MQEVYEFLKKCGTYYLATADGDLIMRGVNGDGAGTTADGRPMTGALRFEARVRVMMTRAVAYSTAMLCAETGEVMSRGLQMCGILPDMLNIVMVLSNAETVEISVEKGIGVSFVSRLVAARGLQRLPHPDGGWL